MNIISMSRSFFSLPWSQRRPFSRLTARTHRRRENFLLKSYPNCPALQLPLKLRGSSNSPPRSQPSSNSGEEQTAAEFRDPRTHSDETDKSSTSGLSGTFGNWIRRPENVGTVGRLDGANSAADTWWKQRQGAAEAAFVAALRTQTDSVAFTRILEESGRVEQGLQSGQPAADLFRRKHIEKLLRGGKDTSPGQGGAVGADGEWLEGVSAVTGVSAEGGGVDVIGTDREYLADVEGEGSFEVKVREEMRATEDARRTALRGETRFPFGEEDEASQSEPSRLPGRRATRRRVEKIQRLQELSSESKESVSLGLQAEDDLGPVDEDIFQELVESPLDTTSKKARPGVSPWKQARSTPLFDIWTQFAARPVESEREKRDGRAIERTRFTVDSAELEWGQVNECVLPLQILRNAQCLEAHLPVEGNATAAGSDISDPEVRTCLDAWRGCGEKMISSVAKEKRMLAACALNSSLRRLCDSTSDTVLKARKQAVLFDTSFRRLLFLQGRDAGIVGEHFLTCSLKRMRQGDAQFSCILDSKGNVLDTAYVLKSCGQDPGIDSSILILCEGHHFQQLQNYLTSYVTYAKQSGMDCRLSSNDLGSSLLGELPRPRSVDLSKWTRDGVFSGLAHDGFAASKEDGVGWTACLELVGPQYATETARVFATALRDAPGSFKVLGMGGGAEAMDAESSAKRLTDPSFFHSMPNNSCLVLSGQEDGLAQLFLLKASMTGELGFILFGKNAGVRHFLRSALKPTKNNAQQPGLCVGGYHAWDVLRMEAGLPKSGQEIKPGMGSPLKASLAWTVDQSKLRNHTLFGWERLFRQLARGPTYKLVGMIAEGPAHAGCCIFANVGVRRKAVGVVTSCLWSPHLGKRIAMGYVKPEYAQDQRAVEFNVLLDIPTGEVIGSGRRRKEQEIQSLYPKFFGTRGRKPPGKDKVLYYLRQGSMRSQYRKLVPGTVIALPFVENRVPVKLV